MGYGFGQCNKFAVTKVDDSAEHNQYFMTHFPFHHCQFSHSVYLNGQMTVLSPIMVNDFIA
jgi:hypothetical protein